MLHFKQLKIGMKSIRIQDVSFFCLLTCWIRSNIRTESSTKKAKKKKQGLLLFLLLNFLLPLSQVLTLTIARNKQSSTSWWSRVTFIHCFFSNCCSDKNVKSSSSNEIYDCVRCELNTFFYWLPVQVNISQRYIFKPQRSLTELYKVI